MTPDQIHFWKDIVADIIVISAILHTLLPPWDADAIAQFPTFQKYYRLAIYLLGYVALHARSTFYPSISTSNGSKVSELAAKNGGN